MHFVYLTITFMPMQNDPFMWKQKVADSVIRALGFTLPDGILRKLVNCSSSAYGGHLHYADGQIKAHTALMKCHNAPKQEESKAEKGEDIWRCAEPSSQNFSSFCKRWEAKKVCSVLRLGRYVESNE